MKFSLTLSAAILAMASSVMAADIIVSNVGTGYGDTDALFENVDGSLLDGGIVAMGYFGSNEPSTDLSQITSTIADFTAFASGIVGSPSASLEGAFAGYVEVPDFNTGVLDNSSPLIGKNVYVFVGNNSTLAASTAFALFATGTIREEEPGFEDTFIAQPYSIVPLIGAVSVITVNNPVDGLPETYTTLKLVPEPSVALLGFLGVFGLLVRRRIQR
jgi:hypothetical protein